MKTLLRIDASARREGSYSRQLADELQNRWAEKYPDHVVISRDLAARPVPHLSNDTIAALLVPRAERGGELRNAAAFSDLLVDELKRADAVLMSVPMYNLSVPSALKAYIDHVVRIGETFEKDANGFSGLLEGKKAYLALSYGSVFSGSGMEALDFVEPYLKQVLGFIGITDVAVFKLEGSAADERAFRQTRAEASAKAAALFRSAAAQVFE